MFCEDLSAVLVGAEFEFSLGTPFVFCHSGKRFTQNASILPDWITTFAIADTLFEPCDFGFELKHSL
jgi:hypothetical protein